MFGNYMQGRRKIFNLWVPSGKVEDQKQKSLKLIAITIAMAAYILQYIVG